MSFYEAVGHVYLLLAGVWAILALLKDSWLAGLLAAAFAVIWLIRDR